MLKKKYNLNKYLVVGRNTHTGMSHGAMYRNHPTPSGFDRYLLSTTTQGFCTEREAGEAINAAYPDVEPLPLDKLSNETADISQVFLKRGSYIQLGYHTSGNKQPGHGEDPVDPLEFIEVFKPGKQRKIDKSIILTRRQLERLEKSGRIVPDCTTFVTKELYYAYKSYWVKGGGLMLNPETTLSKWLPDRIVRIFQKKGWYHPIDLIGKSMDDLFRVTGFGHSAFHVLVLHLYDMGLYLNSNGFIRQMPIN